MKKFNLLTLALVLSTNALADEPAKVMSNLTIAAAETGVVESWTIDNAEIATETRLEKSLEERAQALNAAINARLEKTLEEKLSRELQF